MFQSQRATGKSFLLRARRRSTFAQRPIDAKSAFSNLLGRVKGERNVTHLQERTQRSMKRSLEVAGSSWRRPGRSLTIWIS